jgi:hypothetical protein
MFGSMDSCQRFLAALAVHYFAYNFGDVALRTPPAVFLRDRRKQEHIRASTMWLRCP